MRKKRDIDVDIEKLLTKDIEELEYKIEHRKEYNNKNRFKYILVKGAIVLEMAFPFVLGTTLTLSAFNAFNRIPFKKTTIIDKASVQYEIDSLGNEKKDISYDEKYKNNTLKYSTSWDVSDDGYYQRVEHIYEVKLNDKDYNHIFDLSKEELDSMFKLVNIKTIKKNCLSPDDEIYNDSYILINQVIDDKSHYRTREENEVENLLETLVFLFLIYVEGILLDTISGLFIKKSLKDKLSVLELKYKTISKNDLEVLRNILKQKKENIKLLK